MSTEVKVIDFGGATYEDERHTLIINTRQYRAPEVILENYCWNESSDIWCMACIMMELYTGELFFDTHENLEHLAMIEKQCGAIPSWMAEKCTNKGIRDNLDCTGTAAAEMRVQSSGHRLRWPSAARK
jgi:serine/threonine protein kinase